MANPERGEVRLDVDGVTYTLKLSMNVAATLQARTKKTIGQLLGDATQLDFIAIRSIVWLLLQKYHAADFKTEEQVGDFIDRVGGIPRFAEAINAVVAVNQPDLKKDGEKGTTDDAGHPTDAQAGISDSSILTLVGSA